MFAADIDSSRKVVDLLRPLLSKAKPELVAEVDGQLAAVQASSGKFHSAGGFVPYDQVDEADRATMAQQIQALPIGWPRSMPALGME